MPHAQLAAVEAVLERVMKAGSDLATRYGRALPQRDTAEAKAAKGLSDLASA